jgi:hypothetical protein
MFFFFFVLPPLCAEQMVESPDRFIEFVMENAAVGRFHSDHFVIPLLSIIPNYSF